MITASCTSSLQMEQVSSGGTASSLISGTGAGGLRSEAAAALYNNNKNKNNKNKNNKNKNNKNNNNNNNSL